MPCMRALARKLSLTPRHCAASEVFRRALEAGASARLPSRCPELRTGSDPPGSAATGSPQIVTGMPVSVTSARPPVRSLCQSLRSGPFGRLSALPATWRRVPGVVAASATGGLQGSMTNHRHRPDTPVAYGVVYTTQFRVICRAIWSGAFDVLRVYAIGSPSPLPRSCEWLDQPAARMLVEASRSYLLSAALFPPRTPVW